MYKNIAALITLDETKPLLFIKPLYLSFCQSHNPPLKFLSFPGNKKPQQFFSRKNSLWFLSFPAKLNTNSFPLHQYNYIVHKTNFFVFLSPFFFQIKLF